MANENGFGENATTHAIRFQDRNYRLTREWVGKQVNAEVYRNDDWRWPTLKFLSFHEGKLILLNTCENRSYKLSLQIQEGHLMVSCSCGNTGSTICEHAYAGIYTIIWHLGEHYFQKLQPDGAMTLAFTHGNHFDKKESTAGIEVSPRPELKSVFQLAPKLEQINLPAILKLPAPPSQAEATHSEEALGYLLIVSSRNKLLPALLPCLGKLNKNKTDIKTFNHFLSGVQKQYSGLITDSQRELNAACFHLWKMVEKLPGHLIKEQASKQWEDSQGAVLDAWKKLFPLLQKQSFVYSYYLYGVRELKNRPARGRIKNITLSESLPSIRFVLADKGAFYQLQMQVWVNGKELSGYDAGTTLFIQHQQILYLLPSLKDAAIAEWIHRSGGWITVFKEHFSQFDQEVLKPLRENYKIEIVVPKRRIK